LCLYLWFCLSSRIRIPGSVLVSRTIGRDLLTLIIPYHRIVRQLTLYDQEVKILCNDYLLF